MKKLLKVIIAVLMFSVFVSSTVLASEEDGTSIGLDDVSEKITETQEYKDWVYEFNRRASTRISPKTGEQKTLNIIGRVQETSYWCGPASAQIVIRYLTGKYYSQSTLAASMYTNSTSGTYVYRLVNTLNYYVGAGTYNYIGTWQTSFSWGLSSSLQDGYPVIAHTIANNYLVGYGNATRRIGHYVTCYGYSMGWQGSTSTNDVSYFDTYNGMPGTYGRHTISIPDMQAAINENAGYYIAAY